MRDHDSPPQRQQSRQAAATKQLLEILSGGDAIAELAVRTTCQELDAFEEWFEAHGAEPAARAWREEHASDCPAPESCPAARKVRGK
uniref:hypothetical protein n=1 Tax=Amycolatopsis sp. CA-096443 TaxID=3239919 RepID=UPI003F49B38A